MAIICARKTKAEPQLRLIEPSSKLLLAKKINSTNVEIRLSLKKEDEPGERILAKFLYEMCSF